MVDMSLISLTIHKDEGYFTKNNQNFYPHKNILKKEDNNWYITQRWVKW